MTLMFPKPVFKKKKPKVDIWCDIRRKLEKRFDVVGIDSCEIRLDGCKGRSFLGFAHLDKRDHLSEEDLYIAVLACVSCHDIIEVLPRKQMRSILQSIIDKRRIQP